MARLTVLLFVAFSFGYGFAVLADENNAPDPASNPKQGTELVVTSKPNSAPTRAEWRGWDKGWLRIEGSAKTAWQSGFRDRAGDFAIRAIVDYEVPVRKHLTVSPRLMPFMYWDENNAGNNEIFAAGAGVSLRGYPKPYEYRKLYAELGGMVIGQTDTFKGNSSHFNFMEEIGVGYVFDSNWNVAFKVGHISNADLGRTNAGVNWASLSLGYSFHR